MEPSLDEVTVALEDARARQQSLIDLMLFVDQQAMALMSLYLSVGVAAAGAGLAALGGLLPMPAGVGLFAAAGCLLVGAVLCNIAMGRADVGLVGDEADFWKWALARDRRSVGDIASAYLDRQIRSMAINHRQNRIAAAWLTRAKLLGFAAVAAALIFGVADYLARV